MTHCINALADQADCVAGWCPTTLQPSAAMFSNALQVWIVAQDHTVNVRAAASAFNVTPALIRDAVATHPGLWIDEGDVLSAEEPN